MSRCRIFAVRCAVLSCAVGYLIAADAWSQVQTPASVQPPIDSGRRLALVIGNESYPSEPLKNLGNDARAMSRALIAAGFQADLVTDAYGVFRRAFPEIMEALGEALVVEPYLATVGLGGQFVARGGTEAQQQRILPALILYLLVVLMFGHMTLLGLPLGEDPSMQLMSWAAERRATRAKANRGYDGPIGIIGHTQDDNPYASDGGPFNALPGGLTCALDGNGNRTANYCLSVDEGVSHQISNFGMYQRLFSIYDGPAFQDSNAYLKIEHRKIVPADDQEDRRADFFQSPPRQIRTAASRDDRRNRPAAGGGDQCRGSPGACAEITDPQITRGRVLGEPVGPARA